MFRFGCQFWNPFSPLAFFAVLLQARARTAHPSMDELIPTYFLIVLPGVSALTRAYCLNAPS